MFRRNGAATLLLLLSSFACVIYEKWNIPVVFSCARASSRQMSLAARDSRVRACVREPKIARARIRRLFSFFAGAYQSARVCIYKCLCARARERERACFINSQRRWIKHYPGFGWTRMSDANGRVVSTPPSRRFCFGRYNILLCPRAHWRHRSFDFRWVIADRSYRKWMNFYCSPILARIAKKRILFYF